MEMRSNWAARLLAVGVLAIALTAAAVGGFAKADVSTVTFCYDDQNVRPWRYRNGGGLNVHILEEAARQVGLSVKYEVGPMKNCLARLQANAVDGTFALEFLPEYMAYGVYPGGTSPEVAKNIQMDRIILVRRRGDSLAWDGKNFQHLHGPIQIQSGQVIDHWSSDDRQAALTEGRLGAPELLRLLAAGRIAGAAVLQAEASRVLEHDVDLRGQVEVLPIPLVEKPYYLVLSHRFTQLHRQQADDLWRAIERSRESAAYQLLEKRTLAALGQS